MQWSKLDSYDPPKVDPNPDVSLIGSEPRCYRHILLSYCRVIHFTISGRQGFPPHRKPGTLLERVKLGHSAKVWLKAMDILCLEILYDSF